MSVALSALAAVAEQVEAESLFRLQDAAPPDVRHALGASGMRLGGGTAIALRKDPTGYWSRAAGFGFDEPITEPLLADLVGFYRETGGLEATFLLAPEALPPDWHELTRTFGLVPVPGSMKLACPVEDLTARRSDLTVGRVPDDQLPAWADAFLEGFGMPRAGFAGLLTAAMSRSEFVACAAWDGPRIVGAAGLLVHEDAAHFAGAATLPSHRGRGVQSALLTLRARIAAEAGCRWLVAETAAPAPGSSNASLRNALGVGFTPLYLRQHWVWRAGGGVR